MSEAFLRLVALTKRYGSRAVVDRASLEVTEGEIVALLGPSGCGKTTLLRLIAGLETPDAGEISICGERVAADGRNLAPPHRRGVGFVFQDLALWPHLSVAGNLNFVLSTGGGAGGAGVPKRERADRITETLRLVRMDRFAASYPNRLSGGEQQRVAIARAIVGRPRLLLLDEPMAHLDSELKDELLQEFAALQRSLGVTSVYITHDRAEAQAVAHRIVTMQSGAIKQAPVS